MDEAYDVVVVGAGPGGSMAAKIAAEKGVSVLLLERDSAIGTPVQCAEGIGIDGIDTFLDVDPSWIATKIEGAILTSPSGRKLKVQVPGIGFILERKIFDRDLAMLASRAGAQVFCNSNAVGLFRKDGEIAGVIVKYQGKEREVGAKVVIGADGVNSMVGRWAGMDTKLPSTEFHAGAEYLLSNIDVEENYPEFLAGRDIAPGGYGWVFPKGHGTANVGVGIAPFMAKMKPFDYCEKLIQERFPGASRIEKISSAIPTTILDEIVTDGIMLVGDAARVTDPITGGGIGNAIFSGEIAGRVAAKAVRNGNATKSNLWAYQEEWEEKYGYEMRYRYKAREVYMKLTDKDFESIFDFAKEAFDGKIVKEINPREIIIPLIKSTPRFLKLARHLI
jgi:digeranylgeranylglycerophospholipid reductase